jgi:hypothetical protein
MRIYDPANDILYVHLAPEPAGRPSGTDRRLPAGYANQFPQTRLSAASGRTDLFAGEAGGPAPVLVVLAGGAEAATDTDRSLAPPTLRLA